MWIMLNDGFLSVVDKAKRQGHLLVRARRPGDIQKVFPGVKVEESFGTDYRYRAEVPRTSVATEIGRRIMEIDYSNFKDSTKDKPLHDAYMGVWSTMSRLQPGGPYAQRGGRRRPQPDLWLRGDQPDYDPFFVDEDAPRGRGGRKFAR